MSFPKGSDNELRIGDAFFWPERETLKKMSIAADTGAQDNCFIEIAFDL